MTRPSSSVRVPVTVVKERAIRSMFSSCYDMSDIVSPFYPLYPAFILPITFLAFCIVSLPPTSLPCFPFSLLYFSCFAPPLRIVLIGFRQCYPLHIPGSPLSLSRVASGFFISQPLIFSLLFELETYPVVVLLHLPLRRGSGYRYIYCTENCNLVCL